MFPAGARFRGWLWGEGRQLAGSLLGAELAGFDHGVELLLPVLAGERGLALEGDVLVAALLLGEELGFGLLDGELAGGKGAPAGRAPPASGGYAWFAFGKGVTLAMTPRGTAVGGETGTPS